MTWKIDRKQPKTPPQRPIELARKCPRRRGVAVNEHHAGPMPFRVADRDCAIRRLDLKRFHHPRPKFLSRPHPSWSRAPAKADRPSLPSAFRVLRCTIVTGERDSERGARRRVPVIFAAK